MPPGYGGMPGAGQPGAGAYGEGEEEASYGDEGGEGVDPSMAAFASMANNPNF